MCSIFGIINANSSNARTDILHKMALDQLHRGPDDGGFFEDEICAFGHRRLSIIDLSSNAKQPMSDRDGKIVLVFNGEIYNYLELRRNLQAKGHTFATSSDTECIIHLYEEYGSAGFSQLDGMFAIALYDREKKTVHLLRDRMGKKPLFYFQHQNSLVFGSELSVLKQHPDMPHELDMQSVSDYLSLLYIPCPATIYKNVSKAAPGEILTFDCQTNQLSKEYYFRLDHKLSDIPSFTECAEKLRSLVFDAVQKRLMSDVPVGVFLSGGVDSSIVANVMTQLRAPEKTDAFTIGFEDPSYDERTRARHTAMFINRHTGHSLIHHERTVSPADFSLLRKLVKHYGEPYADASMIPTYLLSRFTRETATVALSGDGADELFAGYERYFLMSKMRYFNLLPYPARMVIFRTLSNIIPAAHERSAKAKIKRAFDVISCRANQQYYRILDRCRPDFKSQLAGEAFKDSLAKLKQNSILELADNLTSKSAVGKYLEFDQHTYLVGDILTKTDIASMASSLELRSPFLDKDVVDFANKLPFSYKFYKNDKKHILKYAFKDMLPNSVLSDSKKGFGIPLASYFRGTWHDEAENILLHSAVLQQSRIFNMDFIANIWQKHQSCQADYSYQLWTIMLFAMFLETETTA
ncbi:MAG: asparagine synthase (glutamine-hydrolyzing) [Lentisphaeria bacterium]|nr:asparagine synthase (glutamine-hydrolyzing) [Lentisphaeria bacterium]